MKVTRLCELANMTPQNYYARRRAWCRQEVDVQLVLEQAFLAVACEELDQSLEGFKKKHGGGRRTRRSRPTRS